MYISFSRVAKAMVLAMVFVTASPAFAQTEGCEGFRTQTPGGWGAPANGNNPGAYRDAHFDEAFPNGLTIGCGSNTITLTSAQAVEAYLPCGGKAKKINGTFVDPACQKNVLSNHLIAATLSVGFDLDDPDFGSSDYNLVDLLVASGPFAGWTVEEVLDMANQVIGNCSSEYTPQQMNDVLAMINENYVGGSVNNNFLLCPETDECLDTVAPEVSGEEALTVECGDQVPFVAPVFTDNEDDDLFIEFIQESEATECTEIITRVWRAEDDCGNFTLFTQVITIVDTTAPVLSETPANVTLPCEAGIPAAPMITATDGCDDSVEVTMTEESEGNGSGCTLINPVDAVTNPDWAMVLFNFVVGGQTRYFTSESATYQEVGDEIFITAHLVSTINPNAGFDVTLHLVDGVDWNTWDNMPFPTSYKDDYNFAGNNYLDWTYYLVDASASFMTGWGDYAGSNIALSHAPSSLYYAFQKGIAANNTDDNYGIGGWMYYEGTFVENGQSFAVDAAGDFAWDIDCCNQPVITRTWTATDCSGNTVSHTQTITFAGE